MAQNTQASCVKRILAREWLWLLGTYIASIACVVYVNLDQMRTSEFDGDVFVVFSVAVSTMPFLYIPIGVVRLTVWAVKAARSRPNAPRNSMKKQTADRAAARALATKKPDRLTSEGRAGLCDDPWLCR